MFKLSKKDLFFEITKAAFIGTALAIKNSSMKLYNNITTNSEKIKTQTVFEEKDDRISKILLLNDGNLLLFYGKDSLTELKIIDGQTYQEIKLIKYNEEEFRFLDDAILISKSRNDILFCDGHFSLKYIEFDDNYNIKNSFLKSYKNREGYMISCCLTLLKNGKIVYKGSKSCYKHDEDINFGLAKIYILKLDKINKDIIMEFKINAFNCLFYEIKSKNEYLVSLKKDYISIINSNNYRTKKIFKFNIYQMKLLNDKFFIEAGEKNALNLYSLDNFQIVKKFLTSKLKEITRIYTFENYYILTLEDIKLEFSEECFIKIWKFDEEKNEIISQGHFKLDEDIDIEDIIKMKGKKDLFLMKTPEGYRIIKILAKTNIKK